MTRDIRPYRLMDLIKDTTKLCRDFNLNIIEIKEILNELFPDLSIKLIYDDEGNIQLYYLTPDGVFSPISMLVDELNKKYYG